jgi:hypothetical protein
MKVVNHVQLQGNRTEFDGKNVGAHSRASKRTTNNNNFKKNGLNLMKIFADQPLTRTSLNKFRTVCQIWRQVTAAIKSGATF